MLVSSNSGHFYESERTSGWEWQIVSKNASLNVHVDDAQEKPHKIRMLIAKLGRMMRTRKLVWIHLLPIFYSMGWYFRFRNNFWVFAWWIAHTCTWHCYTISSANNIRLPKLRRGLVDWAERGGWKWDRKGRILTVYPQRIENKYCDWHCGTYCLIQYICFAYNEIG